MSLFRILSWVFIESVSWFIGPHGDGFYSSPGHTEPLLSATFWALATPGKVNTHTHTCLHTSATIIETNVTHAVYIAPCVVLPIGYLRVWMFSSRVSERELLVAPGMDSAMQQRCSYVGKGHLYILVNRHLKLARLCHKLRVFACVPEIRCFSWLSNFPASPYWSRLTSEASHAFSDSSHIAPVFTFCHLRCCTGRTVCFRRDPPHSISPHLFGHRARYGATGVCVHYISILTN